MINKLLSNKIIKIIGICVIFYFALLHDKKNPDSLGNRLSPERVKKNINEIEEKSKFIVTNISKAKQYAKQEDKSAYTKIAIKDIKINNQGEVLQCGNKAVISYDIIRIDGKVIYAAEDEELIIGSRKNEFLEKNIIAMTEGSIRLILIASDSYVNDVKVTNFLKENKGGLTYKITLNKVMNNANSLNISCN